MQEVNKRYSADFDLLKIVEILNSMKKYKSVEQCCSLLISDIRKYNSSK